MLKVNRSLLLTIIVTITITITTPSEIVLNSNVIPWIEEFLYIITHKNFYQIITKLDNFQSQKNCLTFSDTCIKNYYTSSKLVCAWATLGDPGMMP